ncbi:MAG: alanine racemase, partial [Deltaproteobacteria bacterium]|nr:alanine racemase [Deltaproteobacteria bacterium]
MSVPRPTRVEIDLAALRHNFQEIQCSVGAHCDVLVVVKANAYGHGVSVALVEEGVELRGLGIEQPIVILGSVFPGQEADVLEHHLTPVLYDLTCARRLDSAACDAGQTIDYHLKVDTGMGRLGFRTERLDEVLPALKSLKNLNMTGLMSHLAVADEPERPLTGLQYEAFAGVVEKVEKFGFTPRYRHLANSAGIYSHELTGCNLVRPG